MDRAALISRRLKLRHLNVLIEVVEQGSMAKAAKRLATSQPFVSKAIADLERTLGLRLLERGARGVAPTIYGRALLKRGAAILDDLRTSVSELQLLADPTAGTLRIGSTEAMGASLLPIVVDRLSRQYSRMTFEVVLADSATLQERDLRGRRIDVAFGQRSDPALHGDDLDVTVVYRDHLCVVAGAESPWARRRKIALADLVDANWSLPPPGHPVRSMVVDAFRRTGLRQPQNVVTAVSAPFTAGLVAKGQFLGVLGSVFYRAYVDRDHLKVLPIKLPTKPWQISAVTLKRRAPNPMAQLFIECAREVAKPLAMPDGHG
jgi:DNA-binding transcriptional LysR family regulator